MRLFLDQYGNRYFVNTVKELCQKVYYSKAKKMYCDKKDGTTVHVGYVIGQYWMTEYAPVERPV